MIPDCLPALLRGPSAGGVARRDLQPEPRHAETRLERQPDSDPNLLRGLLSNSNATPTKALMTRTQGHESRDERDTANQQHIR